MVATICLQCMCGISNLIRKWAIYVNRTCGKVKTLIQKLTSSPQNGVKSKYFDTVNIISKKVAASVLDSD